MKKFMAIILAIVLVLSSSVISAGALSLDFSYKINYGENITVKIPDSNLVGFAMVEFVPEKSGYYALTSSAANSGYDLCCDLYSGQTAQLLESNDDYFGLDFCLKYEFEAGKLYYFMITDYDGNGGSVEISLGCGHDYADGICLICSEECPHIPVVSTLGICECGNAFAGTDIFAEESFLFKYNEENEFLNVFRFVPDEDGAYTLRSDFGSEENFIFVDLYDENFEYLYSADFEDNFTVDFSYRFEAGKQYYFVLWIYSEMTQAAEITLERAIHTAGGEEIHGLDFVEPVYPTCTEDGYTAGLYCSECNEYVSGCEVIPMEGHWDYDVDGYCNVCNAQVDVPDCSHICHSKNPVIALVWRFINLINRIFYRNSVCSCGAWHY